ncbi:hypothetical protein A2116_01225 [Candidatus Jorgensenbacteria bacterium GWA1_49_17]|uniref:Uncharacterized protein n=1 Tax=Candidatus Jorgensenbacteria bacterium GWA1_49_17 TaxID=1798467 RepID=A0A1F6BUC0_9BACT|nr:MAG: hypothetical protein UV62_C0016G0004 [Parcubacteria group bacterium GW2011_GWC1_43_11]OGG40147.1 MAG: hypothetical protein A2116_01225 [Candidatus Jorgensenbacteria bacterium GWA1_49_17]
MSGKKITAFIIVLAGLGLAIFIATSGPSKTASSLSVLFGNREDPSLQFEASLPTTPGSRSSLSEAPTTDNYTDKLANSYLEELFIRNGDITGNTNLSLPTIQLSDESLRESIGDLEIPSFTRGDIRVTNDDSDAAQITYIEALDSLFQKYFSKFGKGKNDLKDALEAWFNEKDDRLLKELADGINPFVGELLALEVPETLSDYHLATLNLWQKKLVVYRAFLGMETDPLKTYLALQEIQNIALEDSNLQAALIKRYEELKS